ncbi:MAG: hypothetical protein, partial [Olavius algarvensis Gamma 3 endosymbiont]
ENRHDFLRLFSYASDFKQFSDRRRKIAIRRDSQYHNQCRIL